MDSRLKRVLLATALCSLAAVSARGDDEPESWQVIDPEVKPREIEPVAMDTEDFEVGPFLGILAIQDFDADFLYGLRAAWHFSEDFFFEASYGASQGDLTSYEKLSGGAPLFEDSERDYTFYGINFGWNALPGEAFVLDRRALKSDFFLIIGAGNTHFLDDNFFTVKVGAGYRLLINDWITWRLDVRDHIFDRDAFGENDTTNNFELSTGVTFFF